jgi:type I restriction enzyme, S subunit
VISRGATVGRTRLDKTDVVFCLLENVMLVKPDRQLASDLIAHVLKSPEIQRFLTSLSGSTAQKAIYIRDIKNAHISVAPLAEQRRIVAKIEALFAQADAIEAAVDIARQRADAKRVDQAILARAFRGEL